MENRYARYAEQPLQEERPFDFHTSNIQRARMKRLAQPIVRLGNPIGRPPEVRSLRNARSVNGTQKQNAFSGASARFRVPRASFLPILFWQDRKEWAAGGMPLLCKEKWQNSQYKKALCRSREPFARYEIGRKESIELLSVLASSFRLLLTLQAGAHIMFSLLDFSDNASLCTAALEPLESIFQGFAFLDANFRHRFPSLRRNRLDPDCFQGHSLA